MQIPVILNGAFGKMGQEAKKHIENSNDMVLLASLGKNDSLEKALAKYPKSVVVDFTNPNVVKENTLTILENNCYAIIGTTGLTENCLKEIKAKSLAKNLATMVIPNFSLGATLMMQVAQKLIAHMPKAEIIEIHNEHKKDSPSGTALKTAELMHANKKQKVETNNLGNGRNFTHHGFAIHSVRLPGQIAHQQVIFGAEGESLTIKHDTIDRTCFMPGLLLCIREIQKLTGLIYGLEQIFKL